MVPVYRFKMRIMGRSSGNLEASGLSITSTNSMHFGSLNPVTGSIEMEATATSSWWLLLQVRPRVGTTDHRPRVGMGLGSA